MHFKTIFLSFIVCLIFASAAAAADVTFTPQVPIPQVGQEKNSFGSTYTFEKDGTIKPIGLLIKDIMKYMIGIAGILGTIMLMYGGFLYIMGGAQSKMITDAQNHIVSAIVGIVLAATSYIILATVNTDLVNFKATKINSIQAMGCCEKQKTNNSCGYVTQNDCTSGFKEGNYGCGETGACVKLDEIKIIVNKTGCCTFTYKTGDGKKHPIFSGGTLQIPSDQFECEENGAYETAVWNVGDCSGASSNQRTCLAANSKCGKGIAEKCCAGSSCNFNGNWIEYLTGTGWCQTFGE